nr:immunoglobulin heavy chain junction region [Macaca mulatta]
CVRQDSNLDYW